MTSAFVVTIRAEDDADAVDDAGMQAFARDLDVGRVEKWTAVTEDVNTSTEETLRGGDSTIGNCIVVHVLREEHARYYAAEYIGCGDEIKLCSMPRNWNG